MPLDTDDPRPPYLQIAHALRASILTKKLSPGERLPSGPELARHYRVARMTVQQALKVLRDEGLIFSRAGSGVFVRERTEKPIGLRPHLEQAFAASDVRIDFAGFSGETLHGALQEPLDKVRSGRYSPQSVRLRVLVPDTSEPWALPCDAATTADDPQFRERATAIASRHLGAISESVAELADLGLVKNASVDIRAHRLAPLFKLYLINGSEAFFGFYPVTQRTVTIADVEHHVFDLMGKDAVLFHHAVGDDPMGVEAQFVRQGTLWFDSVWESVARPARP
jgi:DNA-binding transcriptional regulator YhcF (GntR family)